jgi:hypothetical protein
MSLCVNSTAKASDDSHLDVGDGTDNAPRIQLVFIAHKDSVRSHFRDRYAWFCRYDTQPEQALAVQCRTEFTRHLLVSGKGDNLCKTLRKEKASKQTLKHR